VIPVVVTDHDGINLAVINALTQLAEHSVSAVHKYPDVVCLDEVPAASSTCVLPGG
jgi:hypothetical protein